ncbi:MAG: phosphoglycerate kinase [Hyphomicrobiaceae bacterium]
MPAIAQAAVAQTIGRPKLRTLDTSDLTGQTVIVRADLNVPMKNGAVTDDTRLERTLPTLRALIARNARVLVMSHLGRPSGPAPELSLAPVAARLGELMGETPVRFIPDCVGPTVREGIACLFQGEIAVLENLRFHAAEEQNDPDFARELAAPADIYINDAFSCSHRAHASTHAIAQHLPAYAGLSLQAELEALESALGKPKRPVAALVGGAKVSSKIDVLSNLVGKVDCIIIGGGMANTFLAALGKQVGRSLVEPDQIETAKRILEKADAARCRIVLPTDVVVASALAANVWSLAISADHVPADRMILDAGPITSHAVSALLSDYSTLLWNGPLGVFEVPPFGNATFTVARAAAALTTSGKLVTVAGGGDTVAALNAAGVTDKFTYVSTAGGAFLEWLEGRPLPAIQVLMTH